MTTTKYVNVNPGTKGPDAATGSDFGQEFAALVQVKTSRYVERQYSEESGLASKVGIKWTMGTTKGNTFERVWSTGLPWIENKDKISPDGKQISVQIKKNSDAYYMLQKAINEAGFPADRLSTDISVFDGETFFMTTDANPRAQGSARKIYPKAYHPEGWDKALADALAKRASREAQQNAPAYKADSTVTLQSSYAPPQVVQQSGEVIKTAGEALVAILQANGQSVSRNQIPAKLNTYVEQDQKNKGKIWERNFRQNVAVALWDIETLKTLVENNPALKLENEVVSFR